MSSNFIPHNSVSSGLEILETRYGCSTVAEAQSKLESKIFADYDVSSDGLRVLEPKEHAETPDFIDPDAPTSDNWDTFAECKGFTPVFFSEKRALKTIAKVICQGCIVKDFCEKAANKQPHKDEPEQFGVWAAKDYFEAPRDKRRRLAAAKLSQLK